MHRKIFILIVFQSIVWQGFSQIIDEVSLDKRLHYKIEISNATWFIDKYSGGVSSILDKDGKEWIGWQRLEEEKYPESAGGDYRGLPNLVYGGTDNGIGHPGFDKVMCFKEEGNRIRVRSWNGKWEWQYIFHPKYVEMQMLHGPYSERNYWFLYEGIPGGEYKPEKQYWGTNFGLKNSKPDYFEGKEEYGFWQWIFFGHDDSEHALFIVQKQKDDLIDMFGFLGNSHEGLDANDGMVVFGFGRDKEATSLLTRNNIFYIGFYDDKVEFETFAILSKYIQKNFTE